jgi:nanoRNase/pAp phosphatase (c-di-AMP/oligoRNAs hydrolase)
MTIKTLKKIHRFEEDLEKILSEFNLVLLYGEFNDNYKIDVNTKERLRVAFSSIVEQLNCIRNIETNARKGFLKKAKNEKASTDDRELT